MLENEEGYNQIVVFIDRFSKKVVIILAEKQLLRKT